MAFDPNAPFEVVGGFDPSKPFEVVEPRTTGEAIKDTAIDVAKGVVGLGESVVGIADIATGNAAGKGLSAIGYDPQKTVDVLSSGYSKPRQFANEQVSSANGFMETLGALVDNPSVAFGAIVESAPMSLSGVAAARVAALRMLSANGIKAGTTAATKFFADPKVQSALVRVGAAAEGAQTAGSIQETGRQEGREYKDTVGPAVAAGVGTAVIGAATSKIPGFRDAEATAASAGLGASRLGGNLLSSGKEIAKSMFKEGWLEELPQSMQEQIFTNLALDKPWDEGVGAAGAQGAVAGMGQGGGMTAASELANGLTRPEEAGSIAPHTAEAPMEAPIAEPAVAPPVVGKPKGPLATIAEKVVARDQAALEAEYLAYQPELPGDVPQYQPEVATIDQATGEILAAPVSEAEYPSTFDQEPEERQVSMPGRPYRSEVFKKAEKAQSALKNRLTARIVPDSKEYAVQPVKGGFQIHEVGDLSSLEFTEPLAKGKKRLTKEEIDDQNEANRKLFEPAPKTTKDYDAVLQGLEAVIPRESQRAKRNTKKEQPAKPMGEFNPGWFRDSQIKRFDAENGTAHAGKILPLKIMSTLRSYLNGRQLNETQRPAWGFIKDYAAKEYGVEVPAFESATAQGFAVKAHEAATSPLYDTPGPIDSQKKAPVSLSRTMGEITADLTPDQEKKWAEIDAEHAQAKAMHKRQFAINKDNDDYQKKLKGAAMRAAAAKREAAPQFKTAKETAKAAKREEGNYLGKKIMHDGKPAVVVGNVFGAVQLEYEDGKKNSVRADEVTDRERATLPRMSDLAADPQHVAEGMDNPDTALDFFEAAIPQEDRATMADVFAYIRKNGLHRQTSFAQQLFNMVGAMYEGRTGKKLAILGGNADIIGKEAPNELNTERRDQEGTGGPGRDEAEWAGDGTRQGVPGDDRQAGAGPAGTERPAVENNTPDASTVPTESAPSGVITPDSSPKFTIEPLREKSILVKGDRAEITAKLAAAGIKAIGLPNATHGGLTFSKKHEAAIRKALEPSQSRQGSEPQKASAETARAAYNPFRGKAEAARSSYESMSVSTEKDDAMAQHFPLGGGFGHGSQRSRDKAIDSSVNRATRMVEAKREMDHLEAKADAYDRGEISAQGRAVKSAKTVLAEKEVRRRETMLPIINRPGEGAKEITKAKWAKTHNDYKTISVSPDGTHRYRSMIIDGALTPVFMTDAKVTELPKAQSSSVKGKASVSKPAENETQADLSPKGETQNGAIFREDIPNELWLKEKQENSAEDGQNQYGVPRSMGPITGSFSRDLNLPVALLASIPGERGEQGNVRQDSLAYIRDNWDNVSGEAVYVEIDPTGKAWLSEGNHRVMVAEEMGANSLPTTVRYFSGGQRAAGKFAPDALLAADGEQNAKETPNAQTDKADTVAPVAQADNAELNPEIKQASSKKDETKREDAQRVGPPPDQESSNLTTATREAELENARAMLAKDPENALKLALVQQAKERLEKTDQSEDKLDMVPSVEEKATNGPPDLSTQDDTSGDKRKIADFGEKIGGARKDFASTMERAKQEDTATAPLSKSWPEPNYEKMGRDGADPYAVGFARAAREEVPTKPRKSWQNKSWVEQVEMLRQFTEDVVSGRMPKEKVIAAMPPSLRDSVGFRAEMYAQLGHGKSLAGVKVGFTHYGLYHGKENVDLWEVTKPRKATVFGNMPDTLGKGGTRAEAIADFLKTYGSMESGPATKERTTTFEIYRYRGKEGSWIGKKVGKGYIDLKHFADAAAAREYLAGNQADLEQRLEKAKYIPNERRDANRERVGPERASGNVTPEMFTQAFGFRGVEFGNWVNAEGERQQYLNMAHDALADLADVLGIPTQAISLNGELGLAFGARGKGGKEAAAAHYEPDRIVINLTRKQGAGSLAHEWFHAMDSYFARERSEPAGYITDKPWDRGANDNTRAEVFSAFKAVNDAIDKTGLKERSANLDGKRSKDYWSTGIELKARAFENYVIDKLNSQGFSSDYLANIQGEHEYLKDMAAHMLDGPDGNFDSKNYYPYLTDAEIPGVTKALDNLFATIKTKETDKGVALYSKGKAGGTTTAQVETELRSFLKRGYDKLTASGKLRVVQAVAELPGGENMLNMVAYHGSPHRFDKFSTENIGSGEGAQAYGHGLYFAGAKQVAEHYRRSLSENQWNTTDGAKSYFGLTESLVQAMEREGEITNHSSMRTIATNIIDAVAKSGSVKKYQKNYGEPAGQYFKMYLAGNKEIARLDPKQSKGSLYQVELAPSEDEYLLWDKPLSEQSEKVRAALKGGHHGFTHGEGISGDEFYSRLSDFKDGDKAASEYLHSLGIRGIKYLDGTSRGVSFQLDWADGESGIYDIKRDAESAMLIANDDIAKAVESLREKGKTEAADALESGRLVQRGANYNYVIFNDADVSITALYSKDGSIAGVYDPKTGQIALVADNIKAGDAEYVMLHEGLHYQMREDALFVKQHDAILDQFEKLKATDYRVQDAYRRVPSDTAAGLVREEALAYFVQEKANHETSLFKKIMANIRMWLMRMGIPMKNLTTDDLVALVTQGVRRMANQGEADERAVGEMALVLHSKAQIIEAAKAIFSKLEQVAKINFLGMKAQGVTNFLAKQGVKKAEMEAVGLNEWLAAKKPTDKVTQSELVDFVKANTVELEDVVLSGDSFGSTVEESAREKFESEFEKKNEGWANWMYESDKIEMNNAWDNGEHKVWTSIGKTKDDYLAENTDEDGDVDEDAARDQFEEDFNQEDWDGIYSEQELSELLDEAWGNVKDDYETVEREYRDENRGEDETHFSQYTEPGAVEGSYREMFVTAPKKFNKGARIIKTEFDDDAGVEFVTFEYDGEVYEGTKRPGETDAETAKRKLREYFGLAADNVWSDGHSQYSDVKNSIVRIRFNEVNADGKRILRIEEMQGPNPDNQAKMPAHLKDNIYQLGVKRILAYAKENGFDGVALATKPGMSAGDTQADRYSLEKQVEKVEYDSPTSDGKRYVDVTLKGGDHLMGGTYSPSEIESHIGKDAAKKISSDQGKGILSGLDLKVGGEGLKQLYDNQLPAMLEAYGKGKMVDGVIPITPSTPASFPLYSKAMSLENLEETARTMGSITVKKRSKVDSTMLDRIFSTPEYYFKKFAAAGLVLKAALDRRDVRFTAEQKILGKDFVSYVQALRKNNKEAYAEANDYLVELDQSGEGFSLKEEDETWKVIGPDGKMVSRHTGEGVELTEEEAATGKTPAEKEATAAMVEAESAQLEKNGYSKDAIQAVRLARELTNRGFDVMAADMRKIIAEAKEAGLPNPLIGDGTIDESGRYGIYGAHSKKPVALFATEQQANEAMDRAAEMVSYVVQIQGGGERGFMSEIKANAWAQKHKGEVKGRKTFGGLTVRMRTDVEMRPMTVQQALAQMGDMRGTYFPRIRKPGEYVLIAKKDGENPIRKSFDLPMVGDDKPIIQKFIGAGPKWASIPMAREARLLKAQGYDVTMGYDESPVDDVFSGSNIATAIDAILQDSMAVIDKNNQSDIKAGQQINQLITMSVADIFKARGYLSSRLKRMSGDAVWEGYETDMGKALTQYGKGIAAGTAKRDTARAMVMAFSGRDYSWEDYKQEVDKAQWSDYQEIVEERRIDPRRQKNLFTDVRAFMVDVLRNDEQADRIIGTMKGLAVLKFLGFRVSSAAVNATNMVTGVPGTMSGRLGISVGKAMAHVSKAATIYAKFRSGKGEVSEADRAIFQEITDRGWDDAQFNQEAARELRSELGEAWNWTMTKAMYMFGAVEKANRAMSIFAAYKAAQEKNPGASESVIWEKAKEVSDYAHGTYGKETRPAWTRGKFNALVLPYTFAKFTHNYMLNMREQFFSNAPDEMGLDRYLYWDQQRTAAAYLMLSPAVLAGAGATVATPVLMALAKALGIGGDDPEEEFYGWSEKTFGTDRFARHGLAGGLLGINLKGSLGVNIPMPSDLGKLKFVDMWGAPGAIVTDIFKGGKHLAKGEVGKGIEALIPTAFGSAFKAARESSEGITTGNYGQVFYGDEPLKADGLDAALRFFSFNPSRLSGIREKQWNEKEVAAKYQERRTEINAKIKRLVLQGRGITPEVAKEIARYNDLAKGSGRADIKPITMKSIRVMLKRSGTASKFERSRAVNE